MTNKLVVITNSLKVPKNTGQRYLEEGIERKTEDVLGRDHFAFRGRKRA